MRIRRYEMVIILPPDLEESKEKEILDRLDSIIEKSEGVLIRRDDWGVRKLAYEINRCTKGHYYLMDFAGDTEIVTELERNLKIIENVLRFLTIRKEERIDLETAKKEQAIAKEKAEKQPPVPEVSDMEDKPADDDYNELETDDDGEEIAADEADVDDTKEKRDVIPENDSSEDDNSEEKD